MRDFSHAPPPELDAVLPRARNLDDLVTHRDFNDAMTAPGIFDERLAEYATKLVGAWMDRYDKFRSGRSEMHGLHPVAVVAVEALHA